MFVAEFIGSPSMNLCTLPVDDGRRSRSGRVTIDVPPTVADGRSELVVGLRPESLELAAEGCAAVVEVVEEIGADTHVFCAAVVGGAEAKLVARVPSRLAPTQGERVQLRPTGDGRPLLRPRNRQPAFVSRT